MKTQHTKIYGGFKMTVLRGKFIELSACINFVRNLKDGFFFKFFFLKIYLLCIQLSASIYTHTPEEGARSLYRWFGATMWLLGIELRTSGRADSALNH